MFIPPHSDIDQNDYTLFYIYPLNKDRKSASCINGCVCLCPLVILLPSCEHLRPISAETHSCNASVFSNTIGSSHRPTRHTEQLQVVLPHTKGINTALRWNTTLAVCVWGCVSADTVGCVLLPPIQAWSMHHSWSDSWNVVRTCKHHSTLFICFWFHHQPLTEITQGSKWGTYSRDAWKICLWGYTAHEADPCFYLLQANYQSWMLWKKRTLGKKCSIAPQPQGNHHLVYAGICVRQLQTSLLVSIIKPFFHHYYVKLGRERN